MSWIRRLGCIMGAAHRSPPRPPSLPRPGPRLSPVGYSSLPARHPSLPGPAPISPRRATVSPWPGTRFSPVGYPSLPGPALVAGRRWLTVHRALPVARIRPLPTGRIIPCIIHALIGFTPRVLLFLIIIILHRHFIFIRFVSFSFLKICFESFVVVVVVV